MRRNNTSLVTTVVVIETVSEHTSANISTDKKRRADLSAIAEALVQLSNNDLKNQQLLVLPITAYRESRAAHLREVSLYMG